MNRCTKQDNTVNLIVDKSIKGRQQDHPLEGSIAPVGSGMNLAQALSRAQSGDVPGNAEIWVRSFDHEYLDSQMSAIISIGASLVDELNNFWHLACLACNASELEVELWG